jgi:branched-chain amino acid transport system substrate-binding protein
MQYRPLGAALAVALLSLCLGRQPSHAADDTIKIAYIDPFSGTFAQNGEQFLQILRFAADYVNAHEPPLGKKFELVTFDDKFQPAEALIALKQVIDQDIRLVLHVSGSNIAAALIDAVAKNNERNPDHRVLYLNGGALATELTNQNCNFWHFRFSASVEQRSYARIRTILTDVKKVYLLNQDYLFGRSVQQDAKRFLRELRPDIEIVGDELVPLGQVKDFTPYISKIRQSGAQSLITGNFGPDLQLLLKAGVGAGLEIRYDTYLGNILGAVTAIGATGADRMTVIMEYNENLPVEEHNPAAEQFDTAFRKDHKFDFSAPTWVVMFRMLSRAINEVRSTDPFKVALKLEGMQEEDLLGKVQTMRKDDHQLILPLYEGLLTRDVKYDTEGTGLGWKTIATVPAAQETMPTSCKMKRPIS